MHMAAVNDCLLVGFLTSTQRASVPQGRICSDKCLCCHTVKNWVYMFVNSVQSQKFLATQDGHGRSDGHHKRQRSLMDLMIKKITRMKTKHIVSTQAHGNK